MKSGVLSLLVVLLVGFPTLGQDKEQAPPPGVAIRFPDADPAETSAKPVSVLKTGELYVIDSDVPVIFVASPQGLVTVDEEKGPIKISGLFAGNTKRTTKTFKGQQVFTLEPVKSGLVEIILTPVGATTKKDVVRRTIRVEAGEGPLPPPVTPLTLTGNPRSGQIPLTVSFTGTGSTEDIASATLDYGDGTTPSIVPSTHTYAAAGTYTAKLSAASGKSATVAVVVTAPEPPPPPPLPPAPIAGEGLRVLMVFPEKVNLTSGQHSAIYGMEVRNYLNAHTPLGPDGKTHEWRIYKDGENMAGESATWRDAMTRPRTSVPWIIVSNGKTGEEKAITDDKQVMDLIQKYGGK